MHGKSINAEQFHSLMVDIIMQPTTEKNRENLSIFNFIFIESIANELLGDKNPFCSRARGAGEGEHRKSEKTTAAIAY